jgi:GNAT superfamily N-acetyltransferase
MQIREASIADAEEACRVLKRSIAELCHLDHRGDARILDLWLGNKTAENMRRWIKESDVFVAIDDDVIVGVGALDNSGAITLNYVSPNARFRGVSKALIVRLEARALKLGLSRVSLESTATARRFYLSAGYRQTGPPGPSFFAESLCYPMEKQLS